MLTDDEAQWAEFQTILKKDGNFTNMAVKLALVDFIAERERTMTTAEKEEIESKTEIKRPKRPTLKYTFEQLGDSAKSLKDNIMNSLEEEKMSPTLKVKYILGSRAA